MDYLVIGSVGRSHGLGGWAKLTSFSGEWAHFSRLDSVVLVHPETSREKEYHVENFRLSGGRGMFKFRGVDTREEAATLTGMHIRVPRQAAASLQAGEWYWSDLVGLRVLDSHGAVLGRVTGLTESSDDLLSIACRESGREFMVPFRSEFVGEPDMENGTIVLLCSWLLDDS